ncbi:MAG: DUF1826 domain-containing protein [Pseudomonadota bacterium]
MGYVTKVAGDAAIGVGVSETSEGLKVISEPGCAAAIWQRRPEPEIQDWLDQIDPARLPKGRVILRPDEIKTAVSRLCDEADLPKGRERDWLSADIAQLAAQFNALVSSPYMRLRLDVVTTNMCRKFHIDSVMARLICTYRGTGTQYGVSSDGTDPEQIATVPTGAPVILRGRLWPESPASGLLHRSPPIEGSGETRLVLVLDPVFDLEGEF